MNKNPISVFFSCDDNYLPFLIVTIESIKQTSSTDNNYDLYVLHNGLKESSMNLLTEYNSNNIKIHFIEVENKIISLKKSLDKVRDYYTRAIFYRIFIASLVPSIDKAVYLDCDIIVRRDIADLYNIDLKDNILGVINDEVVMNNPHFINYINITLDMNAYEYFNSGVLVMNLNAFRKERIEDKFIEILNKYNFLSVAPDQDYLNYLTKNKVLYIDKSWNKMPIIDDYSGDLNLIHYNLFMKPWFYDVKYDNYFWDVASHTSVYNYLLQLKESCNETKRKNDLAGVERMVKMTESIISSKHYFSMLSGVNI